MCYSAEATALQGTWFDVRPRPLERCVGALSVILAVAGFLIYFWQTLSGEVRPHPLSWFLFGVLSVTGFLVQRDQGAKAGSWALLAMSVICFLLVAVSVVRGERSFPRAEWAFLIAGILVFLFYLFTNEPTVAAVLITLVEALGYGPTFTRGWTNPQKGSVSSFALNGAKFRAVSPGDGAGILRHLPLSGDASRPQRGSVDHAARPPPRARPESRKNAIAFVRPLG